MTVEQSEDRVYVVAASEQGDIYAFDRGTGLLWEYRSSDDTAGDAGGGVRLVNLTGLYRDGRPLFKSAGYIASAYRELPSGGNRNFLFEETGEGHLLSASYDERAQTHHVYLLRR
ncbi:MAG: hypothetical protein ACM3WT_05010, partial [Bacillota bacterium]